MWQNNPMSKRLSKDLEHCRRQALAVVKLLTAAVEHVLCDLTRSKTPPLFNSTIDCGSDKKGSRPRPNWILGDSGRPFSARTYLTQSTTDREAEEDTALYPYGVFCNPLLWRIPLMSPSEGRRVRANASTAGIIEVAGGRVHNSQSCGGIEVQIFSGHQWHVDSCSEPYQVHGRPAYVATSSPLHLDPSLQAMFFTGGVRWPVL